jgi:hypothetical protein
VGNSGVNGEELSLFDVLVHRKWQELAVDIERLNDRASNDADAFPVFPQSSLASDDGASGPYRVSYVLHSCLNAGIDHLHALKSLILDAGVLHVAAPFSLTRGALENFATATWVLTGQGQDERVARALRWHAKNVKDSDRATTGKAIPGSTSLAERWTPLDEVADRRNLGRGYRNGYTSTEAVVAAEAAFPELRLGVLFPWQLCSGFAHGRPWAFHGASQRDEFEAEDPQTVTVRLSSTLSTVLHPTVAAVDLVRVFLDLYAERSRA